MDAELEIIIPTHNPDGGLLRTIASLVAQTDRRFSVLLSDNHSTTGLEHLKAAQNQLMAAGISVRRLQPPDGLQRIEHWNWTHAQSRAGWLKPLFPGEELKPAYVERLHQRIAGNTKAQFIRCDAELRTEWGTELLVAPFDRAAISAAEVVNYFPAHVDWLSRSLPFAYSRTAWLAMGGFSPQLPGSTILNLNVLLALHYGMENLPEVLTATELPTGSPTRNTQHATLLNETPRGRVNLSLELWLILRQAKNYCLAAKLPWPEKCLLWRSFTAALGRW
jgi:hypothetical protein